MVVACGSEKREAVPTPPRDAAISRAADAAIDAPPKPARKVFVTGAGRCGECHGKMYDEWEVSAHAKAVSSPLYKAAHAAAKQDTCDRCHAPLGAEGASVTSEGVTCDVCHTLRDPAPGPGGASFRLAIDDMVKYGPRCNLKDHYFHRMGCSPEHDKAILCGTCHLWEPNGLPVFTEYDDYLHGPAAAKGDACQSCHMPKERAALATGSPVRAGVPHHGLLGVASDLRQRALELVVLASGSEGNALGVTVQLVNRTAGHHVPAGLPERRIVVRVRTKGADGAELETQTRALGRVLVDASGAEVPFWRATKVGSDTRIRAGEGWDEKLVFHPDKAGTLEVDVAYRAVSEAVAKQLGITDAEEQPLLHASLPFGPPGARPSRTIDLKPKPPGRRAP